MPPRKGMGLPSLCRAPTSLGHAWTPAQYISQPALQFSWVCITSSSGNDCEQWWQVTPSRGSQEPGWVTCACSPLSCLSDWEDTCLGTFSLLKYSWLLMLISAIQQSNPDIHLYVYSFPWWFITGYWIQFPVLYSRTLLFICPIYSSWHLLTPNSQSFPLHPHPLATTSLLSVATVLFLFPR